MSMLCVNKTLIKFSRLHSVCHEYSHKDIMKSVSIIRDNHCVISHHLKMYQFKSGRRIANYAG